MFISKALFLTIAAAALVLGESSDSSYACPSYDTIAQPSVDSSSFEIGEFNGQWYMIATNEPTLPPFCKCSMNNVTISEATQTYSYINHDHCTDGHFDRDINIAIKGKLSADKARPGYLMENADNIVSQLSLKPNMIFHITRDSSDEIDLLFSYACLGKLIPFGSELFSFNVLSRRKDRTMDEIASIVASVDKLTKGILDVEKIRMHDEESYNACGL